MAMKVIKKKVVKANKPAKEVKKEDLQDEDEVLDEDDETVEDDVDEDQDDEDVDDDEEEEAPKKKSSKKAAPVKKTPAKKASKKVVEDQDDEDVDDDEEEEAPKKKSSKKAAPVKKATKKVAKNDDEDEDTSLNLIDSVVIEGNALTVDDKAENLKNILESLGLASVNETVTKADADRIFKAVEAIQIAAIMQGKTFKIGGIKNGFSVNKKNVAARVYAAVDSIPGMDTATLITAHTEMTMKAFVDKDNYTFKGKKVKDGVFKTTDGKTIKY